LAESILRYFYIFRVSHAGEAEYWNNPAFVYSFLTVDFSFKKTWCKAIKLNFNPYFEKPEAYRTICSSGLNSLHIIITEHVN